MTAEVPTVAALEAWLSERAATYGEIEPGSFTVDTPLIDLGFNSVYALTLCGDIEDAYGVDVDPTLVWDNPTIRQLAAALHKAVEGEAH